MHFANGRTIEVENVERGGNLRSSKRMQYFKTFTIEYSKIYLCYEMDVYRLDSNYNLSS